MTAELTTEQIVTELLISNEILKPLNGFTKPESDLNLGEFIVDAEKERAEAKKKSRYTFIDLESGWNF